MPARTVLKRPFSFLLLGFSLGVLIDLGLPQSGPAMTFSNGSTRFVEVPRVLKAWTSTGEVGRVEPTYAFTIHVPINATAPLEQLEITQIQGTDQRWYQSLNSVRAIAGTPRDPGRNFAIASADLNIATRSLMVTLDEPIPPGTTFTLTFSPQRNPSSSGLYLFDVRAFPAGPNPVGQALGVSQIQIYDNDRQR